jgi:hypothetical protein
LNLAGVAKILELQDQIQEVEEAMQRWMHEWHERMMRELANRQERVDATSPPKGCAVAVPIRRG